MRQSIQISRISDMEDSPASMPMVSALAGRIEGVMKEMGLTATVTIARQKNETRGSGEMRHKSFVKRRRRASSTPVLAQPPGG